LEPVNVLAIDTATPYLVLGTLSGELALLRGRRHAETIFADIDSFLERAGLTRQDLELIVVGEGPGSYTGLRIGAAAGMGMARALGIPLIGASTLAAVASRRRGRVRPALSARSGHVYTALYEVSGKGSTTELTPPVKTEAASLPADACLLVDQPPLGTALAQLGKAAYEEGARGLNSVYL